MSFINRQNTQESKISPIIPLEWVTILHLILTLKKIQEKTKTLNKSYLSKTSLDILILARKSQIQRSKESIHRNYWITITCQKFLGERFRNKCKFILTHPNMNRVTNLQLVLEKIGAQTFSNKEWKQFWSKQIPFRPVKEITLNCLKNKDRLTKIEYITTKYGKWRQTTHIELCLSYLDSFIYLIHLLSVWNIQLK